MREFHVLSLGAGVQSTCVYLMGCEGVLPLGWAVFADTGDEPGDVYTHLQWLDVFGSVPILIRAKGCLGDDVIRGVNSTGQRFASIPVFTGVTGEKEGRLRRQCTKEYKIEVVDRAIRRDIIGLQPRQRMPKDVRVFLYVGISVDEARRAKNIRARSEKFPWLTPVFPLLDQNMTRADCVRWMADRVPHQVPRSACVYCPYHSDEEWLRLQTADPRAWARAVEVDDALRTGLNRNRKVQAGMYLHRSLVPLREVVFNPVRGLPPMIEECEGMCGN